MSGALDLVREYLSVRGPQGWRETLEEDLGFSPESSSRGKLAKRLGIVRHVKKAMANGGEQQPMLSIIVHLQLARKRAKKSSGGRSKTVGFDSEEKSGDGPLVLGLVRNHLRRNSLKKSCRLLGAADDNSANLARPLGLLKLVQRERQEGQRKRSVLEVLVEFHMKRVRAKRTRQSERKESTLAQPKPQVSASTTRILAEALRRTAISSGDSPAAISSGDFPAGPAPSGRLAIPSGTSLRGTARPSSNETTTMELIRTRAPAGNGALSVVGRELGASRAPPTRSRAAPATEQVALEDVDDFFESIDEPASPSGPSSRGTNGGGSAPTQRGGPQPRGTPLNRDCVGELFSLLFGDSSARFREEWVQGFYFREGSEVEAETLRFGIVQTKGGPCGVLAAVQGFMVKHLLYGTAGRDVRREGKQGWRAGLLGGQTSLHREALVLALAEMLCRAGRGKCVVVKYALRPEAATRFRFDSEAQAASFLRSNIDSFTERKGHGIGMFVLSLLLSRGAERIRADMDSAKNQLIVTYGYCSQELVNLCLVGTATSNVHNGDRKFGGNILRGISGDAVAEVGLLTRMEHFKHVEVGPTLKSPRLPIWLVASESHYSLLFAAPGEVPRKFGQEFDIWYYDGLANQDEEYRLTVSPSRDKSDKASPQEYREDDLTPPLNQVIWTKWPGARISWNASDPLL